MPDETPSAALIAVEGVTSRYGRVVAIDDLTFSAGRGVCALLGPNGAGKTTLMSAVMGLKRFEGSINVAGVPLNAARASQRANKVGYLPQQFDLAGGLRVGETVEYAAWCNGRARRDCPDLASTALVKVGLAGKRTDKVRTLSGGERQRLGIACALAHDPSILLLDEPTVGLDPSQRSRLRKYLVEISGATCVMLATHLLEDVQIVADKVVVLNRGSVVFQGSTGDMAAIGREDRGEHESALESAYRHLISGSDDG
jgi:ABC-2 type transport system ATP-binding protein